MVEKVFRTACPRDCFGGCSMNVYIENGRIVKIEGEKSNRATGGVLCTKGMSYVDYVYSKNRIKYPMIREGKRGEGNFERVSWEFAEEKICANLRKIKEEYGPLSLMFYSSGGCGGILSEYYRGFFDQFEGYSTTRGNLCYSAGIEAVKRTYGSVEHNAPWDMENASLIILWGKNPANTNVQEMKFIRSARESGCALAVIDPIKTSSSSGADLHISPLPGTDYALALCIANLLIIEKSIDQNFVNQYTEGFQEFKDSVSKYTPTMAAEVCKIKEEEIYSLVRLLEKNKPITLVCGYGVQRYQNGGQTVRAISSIPALLGQVGIPGGGFRFANKISKRLKWPYAPEEKMMIRDDYPASQLGRAIMEYDDPPVKMLWVERANPLTMNPDTNGLIEALKKLDFIVVAEQFMTDTALYADLILPAQSFFEYDDIFRGYWTPYISAFRKVIEPFYEDRNESEIYRALGQRMGYDMKYLPVYDENAINNILTSSGIETTFRELIEKPYLTEDCEIAFKDRVFKTASGKIELSGIVSGVHGEDKIPNFEVSGEAYPLRFLSTHDRERIHSQFADIERLKENRKGLIFINPADAMAREINDGDMLQVYNGRGAIYAVASVTGNIKKGVVNVYEGLSEASGASVNKLTAQLSSDMGDGAAYYDCFVEVRKWQP